LVSVDSSGAQTNGESWTSSISSDGRYVAFLSMATLLVSGDDNWEDDVFLHDRQTSQTIRVSVDSAGAQADDRSTYPNISGDGRHVSFISDATNLVAGDTNNWPDVFVHHLDGGETVRVNVADDGTQANGYTIWSSISNSGACVTFVSGATNLAIGDDNNERDVFVNGPRLGSQPPLLLLQD
jgi:Tol biopolymer transport system component